MSEPLSDLDLMAYADGQLPADRAAVVEVALARDPTLATRVVEIRQRNADLTEAFDPWLSEPLPERLLAAAMPPRIERLTWLKPALSVAAALIVGIAIGWFGREGVLEQRGTPTTFAQEAAFTHVLYAADQRRPVEVWANEEKGLVTWLTRRLNYPVRAPDLNSEGFSLVGGRLVAGNARPTGLFMYENPEKQRLTLQVRKLDSGSDETAFRYALENGVGVFYWIEEECAYAISGNLERGQLLAIARVVYGQLAARDAAVPPR